MEPVPSVHCGRITRLLHEWSDGDPDAAEELLPLVYGALHRIAVGYFQHERADHTLEATAIVHEAYLALVEQNGVSWKNRSHFIGFMAHVMRRILVDYARERAYAKRGGRLRKVTLVEAAALAGERSPDIVALDDAMLGLAAIDPRKATLVELRFFGGLTIEESATALGISRATAIREWQRARAWLYRELEAGAPS